METVLSKRRRELKETLRQSALERLGRAASALYREGAEDVFAFGSILKPAEFNERSDADIAVKGIPESRRHHALTSVEDIFEDMPFDLVFLEDELRPEVRARIQREGVRWKP
jgi:predicted nucleotidyltransferase